MAKHAAVDTATYTPPLVLLQDERDYITIALGDLNTELKVLLTGWGVPVTPYTLFHTLEA